MNWKKFNDDTMRCESNGVKMEVNYMRSHWAWIVISPDDIPLGGSFLSGNFSPAEDVAILEAEFCAHSYLRDPDTHLANLQDRTSEKFTLNLEVNGIRAILVSMILYEHTQKKEYAEGAIATDDDENMELNKLAKSILDQWGEFNLHFKTE